MKPNRPEDVTQALCIMWLGNAAFALIGLMHKVLENIDFPQMISYFLVAGVMCIFPYLIGRGSNAARVVYTIIGIISILMLLGGSRAELKMPNLDYYYSIATTPIYIFMMYKLFTKKANAWFASKEI
jgi:hypothetical protein